MSEPELLPNFSQRLFPTSHRRRLERLGKINELATVGGVVVVVVFCFFGGFYWPSIREIYPAGRADIVALLIFFISFSFFVSLLLFLFGVCVRDGRLFFSVETSRMVAD